MSTFDKKIQYQANRVVARQSTLEGRIAFQPTETVVPPSSWLGRPALIGLSKLTLEASKARLAHSIHRVRPELDFSRDQLLELAGKISVMGVDGLKSTSTVTQEPNNLAVSINSPLGEKEAVFHVPNAPIMPRYRKQA